MEMVAIQFDNFEEKPILSNRGRHERDKFCFLTSTKVSFPLNREAISLDCFVL